MTARVVMYSTAVCPYCMMAERLLKSRGVTDIEKILIDNNDALRAEMMEKTNPVSYTHLDVYKRQGQNKMKKTLIALAVLGAAAGVAHAQSNVTIYGIVDTGFIKKSGQDVKMGENVSSRLGFRGVEDLGGGVKATFQLENWFEPATRK